MKIRTEIQQSQTAPAVDTPWTHVNCNTALPNVVASNVIGPFDYPVRKSWEAIESENGKGKAHPCMHRRKSLVLTDDGKALKHSSGAGGNPGVATWNGGNAALYRQSYFYTLLEQHNTWDVTRANDGVSDIPPGWTFGTQIKDDSSLANDCYEAARQLKADVLLNVVEANQIWPSIRSLATCIPEMGYYWGNLRKQIRHASGAYLAWKFGVSPILQDMSVIHKSLPRLSHDIDAFANGDKNRYSAITAVPASFDMAPEILQNYNGYAAQLVTYRGKANKPPVVRYVLVVRPKVKYETQLFKQAAALMSFFATGPATLAWELMPWSFVVDWFVDLRGYLRKLDDALASPPYRVISFTRSLSYHLEFTKALARHSPCDGSVVDSADCGTLSHIHYERSLVPPGYSTPSWRPRFGKNQAGIAAALIAQSLSTNRPVRKAR